MSTLFDGDEVKVRGNLRCPISVMLTEVEVEFAIRIGKKRHSESIARGYRNKFSYKTAEEGLAIDINGACGELAFCKGVNIEWGATVGTFKAPDALSDIQIRTAPCKNVFPPMDFGNLILWPERDDPEHYYVLVVGKPPNFLIKGWILGRDGMKDKWCKRVISGNPESCFVPWKFLCTNLGMILTNDR